MQGKAGQLEAKHKAADPLPGLGGQKAKVEKSHAMEQHHAEEGASVKK